MIDSTSQGRVRVENMMHVMCVSAILEGLSKQWLFFFFFYYDYESSLEGILIPEI